MDEATIRAALVRRWAYEGVDFDRSYEIYHDDAVLEMPQSGERFVGRDAFLSWRKRYPATLEFRLRRFTNQGDLWVAENLIRYDGGPWNFTLSVLQFRGDKIATEYLYATEGFEAAEWRAPWVTRFDPLASTDPADWHEGEPLGLEREAVAVG